MSPARAVAREATEVIKNPTGIIHPGDVLRVPFLLNEADVECTVVLRASIPVVDLALETPSGFVLTPGNAAEWGATYAGWGVTRSFRFSLPLTPLPIDAAGTWKAILTLDKTATSCAGVRYAVRAMTRSNLRLRTSVTSGSRITVRAAIEESGLPVENTAGVRAEMTRPDGTNGVLVFQEIKPGLFEASTRASQAGVYRFAVHASGVSRSGALFTREQFSVGQVPGLPTA